MKGNRIALNVWNAATGFLLGVAYLGFAPSAIGHARISASGHTRRKPRAMAAQIAGAASEPLNESGAMTTIGGREDGMAYDFYRANLSVADFCR